MTVLDRAEVILTADDAQLIRASRRGGVAMVALGNVAAVAADRVARSMVRTGGAVINAAIEMERLERGLDVTAGGAERAARQMARLEQIAKLPGLGFREAIEGANQLNVAFSDLPDATARSSRTLAAFGKAVALTGGGRSELQRVITQVTQIASAGKLLQQDLRPIIQTAPAVGQALKSAFGTISPQEIEALGLSTTEFLDRLVDELEDLEDPPQTAANALENVKDSAFRASSAMGEMFVPAITTGATLMADELERIATAMEAANEESGFLDSYAAFLTGGGPGGPEATSGAQEFLGGRSSAGEDLEAMRARTEQIARQTEAIRGRNEETIEAGLATEQLNERIAFLQGTLIDLDEPAVAWATNLDKLDMSSRLLDDVTGDLNTTFEQNKLESIAVAGALDLQTAAQKRLNDAKRKGASILSGLGFLGTAFGLGIPGLDTATGLFGAFSSFSGLFAEGGTIPAGEWGIVGERGPEIVTGPAEVMPMAGAQGTVTLSLSDLPPARTPFDVVRDGAWLRILHESNLVLEENGG